MSYVFSGSMTNDESLDIAIEITGADLGGASFEFVVKSPAGVELVRSTTPSDIIAFDAGTSIVSIHIPESTVERWCAGAYPVGLRVFMGDVTRQLFAGSLTISEGHF